MSDSCLIDVRHARNIQKLSTVTLFNHVQCTLGGISKSMDQWILASKISCMTRTCCSWHCCSGKFSGACERTALVQISDVKNCWDAVTSNCLLLHREDCCGSQWSTLASRFQLDNHCNRLIFFSQPLRLSQHVALKCVSKGLSPSPPQDELLGTQMPSTAIPSHPVATAASERLSWTPAGTGGSAGLKWAENFSVTQWHLSVTHQEYGHGDSFA